MPLPYDYEGDYEERVYAGVLGKLVGVYLGRPFEGWTHERIRAELGEITGYVHERCGVPLVVTDDDIAGTFTFLRALADAGYRRDLTPAQIGEGWLNYIVERRTILWWGGLGNSTEHTAYLRLKGGVLAPRSGSHGLNGRMIAEQIGAQIFIDGWAMVAPGDPELAADLARRAASVSHDGEAIHGAQVVAAMEAQAFVEPDIDRLLDTGVSFIPRDSTIRRLIDDLRDWHAAEPDWRRTRERVAANYGYDRFRGNCHLVPNHALIVLGLLYGGGRFGRSLAIVNGAGWDTDCNSGNLGCLLGIRNGLAAFEEEEGPDWRGPVADRLYLSTADGGRAITDAPTEAYHIINGGRALAGLPAVAPKGGARFHFALPGAVQGFQSEAGDGSGASVAIENVARGSRRGARSLALRARGLGPNRPGRVATPTFIPPGALAMPGYALLASPTLYPGQTVRAGVLADGGNARSVGCRLFLRAYGPGDELLAIDGPGATLAPGEAHEFAWQVADTEGAPVVQLGLELFAAEPADATVYLDYVGWDGAPDVTLTRPRWGGELWRRAWVDGVDQFEARWPEPYRIVQNRGVGLLSQGGADWADYRVSAAITPHLAAAAGVAARVGGMRRYYALTLNDDGTARLVKALDGITVLASRAFPWEFDGTYACELQVSGNRLQGSIDGRPLFDLEDPERPLLRGGVAFLCEEGCLSSDAMRVRPVE